MFSTVMISSHVSLQECTPENVSLKRKVFGEIDKYADDDVVLASSTSCIVPSTFTSDLTHKTQCIVAHPVRVSLTPFFSVPSPPRLSLFHSFLHLVKGSLVPRPSLTPSVQ